MPDINSISTETAAVQHNLNIAIEAQRAAHESLIVASAETQHWRDVMARIQQKANANKVVHRQ